MIVDLARVKEIKSLPIFIPCDCNNCSRSIGLFSILEEGFKYCDVFDATQFAGLYLTYQIKDKPFYISFVHIAYNRWEMIYALYFCPLDKGSVFFSDFEDFFEELDEESKEHIIFNLNLFTVSSYEDF